MGYFIFECPLFPSHFNVNIGMRIHDLLNESIQDLTLLVRQCSQFLEEAGGQPLLKNLSTNYSDFQKVKVRKRRGKDFDQTFNEAFEHYQLRERSVFANGPISFISEHTDVEPYFIFPIDGYKFLYSREIENSKDEYKQVFNSIFEGFGADKGNEVITEMLKFTYTDQHLSEGISDGAEIIIYNIPYYYAVRANTEYEDLLTDLANL